MTPDSRATSRRPRRGRPPSSSADTISLAALELFAEQGFEETTLPEIAAAAGVSRSTLLRHFPSKGAIVWKDQADISAATAAWLDAVPADVPWRQAVVDAMLEAADWPPEQLRVVRMRLQLIDNVPSVRRVLGEQVAAGVEAMEGFIARRSGEDPGALAPRVTAYAVSAAGLAAWLWWAREGDLDPREPIREALRVIGLP